MKQLQVDSFKCSNSDIEFNQYKILAGLKEYRTEFNKNKIYPALAELVYLSSQLEEILNKKNNSLSIPLPKNIKGKNINDKNVFVEVISQTAEKNDYFYELIEWALPQIKDLISEAYIIYDFVDKNLKIESVGNNNLNDHLGYLIIPDNSIDLLQVFKYDCVAYTNDSQPYRSLKTSFLTTIKNLNYYGSIEMVKKELLRNYKENPEIATYFCDTDLDFSFNDTIYPIAKRKLLTYLFDEN
jgi:hypothetical protein